ncbi:MAG: hypothetical protein ACK50J_30005 [Planctomyces sp.]
MLSADCEFPVEVLGAWVSWCTQFGQTLNRKNGSFVVGTIDTGFPGKQQRVVVFPWTTADNTRAAETGTGSSHAGIVLQYLQPEVRPSRF